jgi:hypothetical protein
MTQIRAIIGDLQDTDLTIERLLTLAQSEPHDEIAQFNLETIKKRRADLERKLNYELRHEQADVVEYKIQRVEVSNYPAKAIAASIMTFQELVTAVFDAIRTTPKKTYKPSPASIDLSAMDFAGARAGSVVVAMSVHNERLLAVKSQLDDTFDLVVALLRARTDAELRELVNRVGVASISRAYNWADNSAAYGLDTSIVWSKAVPHGEAVMISKQQALELKDAIEATSDEEITPQEYDCELIGIDDDTSYFHIKIPDGTEVKGGISNEFPKGIQWVTHENYRVFLSKSVKIKYSTGEEKERWTLVRLEKLTHLT